jgi:hypothetical protein
MKKIIFLTLIITIFILSFSFGCGKKVIKNDINVTILDSENKPLSDVNLTLDGKSGKTDKDGKYKFPQIEEGSYTLKASKDGYEDGTENILVSEGKSQNIKIVLNKKASFEEIKSFSDISSFHLIGEYRTIDAKGDQKVEIISEDNGKREYLKVTDLYTNKLISEMYLDEKVGRIRYEENGNVMELKREELGSITESFKSMTSDLIEGLRGEFNERIKTPEGVVTYSIKKEKEENVNNYSTTKYVYEGETTYQNEKAKFRHEIWVINKGEYKNMVTKINGMLIVEDGMYSYTINIFDYGKAKVKEF